MVLSSQVDFKDAIDSRNSSIEGLVAYYIINTAGSYTIEGMDGMPVNVTLAQGCYPGGISRITKTNGDIVDVGNIVLAIYHKR